MDAEEISTLAHQLRCPCHNVMYDGVSVLAAASPYKPVALLETDTELAVIYGRMHGGK